MDAKCTHGLVYPAQGSGYECTGTDAATAPPMGSRFYYDRTPAVMDGLVRSGGAPLPAWKKTILKALHNYGGIIGDTTNSRWGFEQESGYQYYSASGVQRWFDFGAANQWRYYDNATSDPNDPRWYGRLYDTVVQSDSAGDIEDGNVIDVPTHLQVLKPCVTQGNCPSSRREALKCSA